MVQFLPDTGCMARELWEREHLLFLISATWSIYSKTILCYHIYLFYYIFSVQRIFLIRSDMG